MDLNRQVFDFVFSFSGKVPLLDAFGVFLAEYLPYFLIIALFFLISSYSSWKKRATVFSFLVFVPLLGRGVIGYIIGFVFPIARPFIALDFVPLVGRVPAAAFPSGHATVFFSLAFALFFLNRSWGWSYLLAACLIGLARVFVGVHWPLDILGGILIALISTSISWYLFNGYLKKILFRES